MKPALIARLRQQRVENRADAHVSSWQADDWRAFFDERAGIAEFDAKLPRPEAEALVFACCVAEWLIGHPVRSEPGRCLGCGLDDRPLDPLLPYGGETAGHVWLHAGCWRAWRAGREAEAADALAALGVPGSGTA